MNALSIFWIFLKLGCTSFGGPIAHLAYFRQTFVKKLDWFSESEYGHLLSICQLIPGPASSQVGFSIGLLRGGWIGAILAFIGFTLPSVLLLLIFANSLYLLDSTLGNGMLQGLAILAFIVVLQAVLGMGKQLLTSVLFWILALAVFTLVLMTSSMVFHVASIAICAILSALLSSENPASQTKSENFFSSAKNYLPSRRLSLFASMIFVLFAVLFVIAPQDLGQFSYAHGSPFFLSGATVFGGGHVVLPFLEHSTVAQGLITENTFLAGYGATQAVPGPMFSFAAYLGYTIDINEQLVSGSQRIELFSALSSAILATLYLFLPGFLLIIAVLPISQKLVTYPKIRKAFDGANAAVVGLLAATLYDPIFTHAIRHNFDLAIAAIGFVALTKLKIPVLAVVVLCVLLKGLEAVYT